MERHRREQEEEDDGMRHLPKVGIIDPPLPGLALVQHDVRFNDKDGDRRPQPDLEPPVRHVRAAQDGVVDAELVQPVEGGAQDRRALHLMVRVVGREGPDRLLHLRRARRSIVIVVGTPLLSPPLPVVQEAGRLHVGVVAHALLGYLACIHATVVLLVEVRGCLEQLERGLVAAVQKIVFTHFQTGT